ncbi:MAG: hypothetical protein IRY97_09950, partial [Thermomicrobiaceae bacterium]|nr:hypothetical protein [Thermomicrobiaceae bacterium]
GVPTYAALGMVGNHRAVDRAAGREPLRAWIDGRGEVSERDAPAVARAGQYVAQTRHNLPDVTVALFARRPFGVMGWVEALGYPISEPYWAIYRRNGVPMPSLIQVFERRVLVYTPGLPADQRFTIANTGRHYYRWRYGSDPPQTSPGPLVGPVTHDVAVEPGYQAGVYAQGIGTPVGLAIGPAGNLWILTEEGSILQVMSERSDGAADQVKVFAQGLANPRGIAVAGTSVFVSVDDGVVRLDDINADGQADQRVYVSQALEPASGPRGAPSVDGLDQHVFVSGTLLPERRARSVAEVTPMGEARVVVDGLANPGPVLASHRQLFVADQSAAGSALYRLLIGADGEVSGARVAVATFPPDAAVSAVLASGAGLLPGVPADSLFVAVERGGAGRIVRT